MNQNMGTPHPARLQTCVGGLEPAQVTGFYAQLVDLYQNGGHSKDPSTPILVPVDDGAEGATADTNPVTAAEIWRICQPWQGKPGVADLADTDLIAHTSGSTLQNAKLAALTAQALLFSARATLDYLGGPGVWVLALPVHHIAGIQILTRAFLSGTAPVVATRQGNHFVLDQFIAATWRAKDQLSPQAPRLYTALVPRQLQKILADPEAIAAARQFDAILVGGQATPSALKAASEQAGLHLVTTYGSTETAAGCVYDGRPLPGVQLRIGAEGAVEIRGSNLMLGYLNAVSAFTVDARGEKWLRTSDRGRLDEGGRLEILGRLDDVVIINGLKVSPSQVASCLESHPLVSEAVVVDFGAAEKRRLGAALLLSPGQTPTGQTPTGQTPSGKALPKDLQTELQQWVNQHLGKVAVPNRFIVLPQFPRRGIGKVDRAAVQSFFVPPAS